MAERRWPGGIVPAELGAVVHGPRVLSRAEGITAGLRCVFAHTGGLHLVLTVHATGVKADAAGRQYFGGRPLDEVGPGTSSSLAVRLEVGAASGEAHPSHATASGGVDVFDMELSFWVDQLPADGRVGITVAWPQAGLPETRSELQLVDLDGYAARVLPLT